MADEWHILSKGQIIGPVSGSDLIALARSGKIQRDSRVRRGLDGEWVEAHRVRGLFGTQPHGQNEALKAVSPPVELDDRRHRGTGAGSTLRTATLVCLGGVVLALLLRLGLFIHALIRVLDYPSDFRVRQLLEITAYTLADALPAACLLVFLWVLRSKQSA